ncbi:MAG: hypothetical protein KF819_03265 [Labilithrix sp.]|nr:hypothetical protein [Labilithrix sp.]
MRRAWGAVGIIALGVAGGCAADPDRDAKSADATRPQIDRTSLGATCESSSQCARGNCVLYVFGQGDAEGHCTDAPSCDALACPPGTECSLTGAEPAQMACAVSGG